MKDKKSFVYNFLYKMDLLWLNIAIAAVLVVLSAYAFVGAGKTVLFVFCVVLLVLILTLNFTVITLRKRKARQEAEKLGFSDENGTVCSGLLDAMQLPAFIVNAAGKLCWANVEFKGLCESLGERPARLSGMVFSDYIDTENDRADKENDRADEDLSPEIEIGGRNFKIYISHVMAGEELLENGRLGYCVLFTDITAPRKLIELYKNRKIAFGEILVDNYEEIFQASGDTVANQVLIAVNNIFAEWIGDLNAIIRRLTRERFIIVVEEESLAVLEKRRFDILEKVKNISVGNTIPVTVSIGLSTNRTELTDKAFEALISGDSESPDYRKAFKDTLSGHFSAVDELLNLSLSRGGDQAIVRTGEDSRSNLFFGGSEIPGDREDMVAVRVNAGILRTEIEKSRTVLVMGHAHADLDSLGAALAVYRISVSLGRKAYIVLGGPNSQIAVMYNALSDSGEYGDVFISGSEALNILDDETLTVVVDTFSEKQCEAPDVVKNSARIIVIDHHRRGVEFIKNTIINYTDTMASSASELVCEMLRYIFPTEKVLTKLEAETLYGGILVDTKNMFFKTGKRTFDVCSYLRQMGVVPVAVRKYVQPGYEDFKKINEIVSAMRFVKVGGKGVALAVCSLPRSEANTLAPIAADKMLEVAGVDCSFVIIRQDADVAIKARSLGEVNVQIILEHREIEGGGHFTAAAGYVKNCTPERAEQLILGILKSESK
ncbi:MAG: DHH family phosphoesterase [Clostridia bacterium]|nr:DHH family phosphoesterase [Clostridia bacterium]